MKKPKTISHILCVPPGRRCKGMAFCEYYNDEEIIIVKKTLFIDICQKCLTNIKLGHYYS